jgi:hypothetical protein
MNTIYKKLILVVLAMTVIVTSCTDELAEINNDPNEFTDASPELLLAGVMKEGLDLTGGVVNFWMYLQYGRYCGGMRGNAMQQFGVFEGFVDNYWERYYRNVLKPARLVQDVYGGDEAFTNRVQISRALEAWAFSVVTSTWGPIPASQALGDNIFTIPLDNELDAYTFILTTLEEASDIMGTTASDDALTTDLMYDGNNENWLRFINTLRLKIALRLTGARNPELVTLGNSHIADVVANDINMLITDNSQNARLLWGSNALENYSIMFERTEINQSDNWRPSVNDEIVLWCKAYDDPRLTAFAEPSVLRHPVQDELDDGGTPVEVVYGVPYLGSPVGGPASYPPWGQDPNENPLQGADLPQFSEFNAEYRKQDSEFMIISSSETMFILAEIAARNLATLPNSAQFYYNLGIDQSFERYGSNISVPYDVEAYKSQPGIAYNVGSTETLYNWVSTSNTGIADDEGLKQIVVQRWLTMFFQGHDAWCLQKRTGLLSWGPFLNPAQRNTPLDHPHRMKYSEVDKGKDPDAYNAAISELLGGIDLITTPIDMNKQVTPVDWPSFEPEFSSDFGTKWYGESIADLEAAGLADVTALNPADQLTALQNGTGYVRIQ